MDMAWAKGGMLVTVAFGETNYVLALGYEFENYFPLFLSGIKGPLFDFLFNLCMMYKILWKKTQDAECVCLCGCSVHVVVRRQPDLITDALLTHCIGKVLDLLFSAWMLEPICLVKEHLSYPPSVTVVAEETIPQMYYFNRNQVLVSHTSC